LSVLAVSIEEGSTASSTGYARIGQWIFRAHAEAELLMGGEAMTKKGYWVAMVDIADQEGYKEYIALNKAAFDKYGANFVVRAGQHQVMEGPDANRVVVIEFKDYETALACYNSPEYQKAVEVRGKYAKAHLSVVEGV
jgi:uncharacterized protein (DUF1330 family)